MGRSVPRFLKAAVIASACAMLCAPARAQSTNNDGYGLSPIPGVAATQVQSNYPVQGFSQAPQSADQFPPQAAPLTPVQQGGMAPAQNYSSVYAGPQGYSQPQPFTPPQAYAQPQPYAPQQAYQQQPYTPVPGYAPAQGYGSGYGQQGYAPAPVAQIAPVYGQSSYGQPSYAQPAYGAAPAMPAQMAPQTVAQNTPPAPYGYAPLRGASPNMPYGVTQGENIYAGYILGAGDKVRVNVFGEEDLSGEYQVDGSGLVRLPLIGTIRAGGSTAPALGMAISGALSQGYLKTPRVNVEITSYRPFYIIGSVNRPGTYPYVNNMTALDAVALGGGFTDKARESTVYVRHEGSSREEELPASQLTHIYPGDVVRVKSTIFWDAMDAISPVAGPAAIAATVF